VLVRAWVRDRAARAAQPTRPRAERVGAQRHS
jgi:hypothetical protein